MNNRLKNIVVIDDEKYVCSIIREALAEYSNYQVSNFTDPEEALKYVAGNCVDLVLTDLVMGDFSGVQILETTIKYHPDAVVILMTGYPTVKTAISVLQKGGYDYLVKPFKLEDLKSTILRGLEHQRIKRENVELRAQVELMRISDKVAHGIKLPSLLTLITETAVSELNAEGASIILLDRKAKKYRLRSIAGERNIPEVSEFLNGESPLCADFLNMEEHFKHCEPVEIDGTPYWRNYISYPLLVKGRNIGALNLVCLSKYKQITGGQENLISLLASAAASSAENNYMDKLIRRSYLLTIKALANAVEARDAYTAGHTDRVFRVARAVALELGWDGNRLNNLRTGSILHDIGKIGVPDAILNKPDKLTDEEFEIMRKHPETGARILGSIPFLKPVLPYVLSHHEKYDGSGYPYGLKGEEIPIEGRLLSVIDTFDAILSDRPYRKSADPQTAMDELIKYRGTQFDPEIVDAFLKAYNSGRINCKSIYGIKSIESESIEMKTAPV